MEILINLILVLVVSISVYTDLKERKIYNMIVIPAAAAGLVMNSLVRGVEGLTFSLMGLGVGLALLFIPFAFGGVGAGDVKLLGAIGALNGSLFVFKTFLATGLTGGVLAVIVLIRQGNLLSTIKRLVVSLYILAASIFKVNTLKTLDKAEYHESLPYGLAIGIGTFLAYLVG